MEFWSHMKCYFFRGRMGTQNVIPSLLCCSIVSLQHHVKVVSEIWERDRDLSSLSYISISLLSVIFIDIRKSKSTPILILLLIQLIYHSLYNWYFLTLSFKLKHIHYICRVVTNKIYHCIPSGLVGRCADWCPDDRCFAITILSSSFLRTIWQSSSMCLVLSWNTSFSTMCIAALLSPYKGLFGRGWNWRSEDVRKH